MTGTRWVSKTRPSIDGGIRRWGSLRTILAFSFAFAFALALPVTIWGSSIGAAVADLSQYKSPGWNCRPSQPGYGQQHFG
ncbi:hypothetical protein CGRA01v4_10249 [Colletotrichum graminicola]|nr:hypothetical protein CGRA01v4_10249 [Colletotrichum graminicola]